MTEEYDYCVFSADNLGQLVNSVQNAMKHGWLPQGGVSRGGGEPSGSVGHNMYVQAMIKSE